MAKKAGASRKSDKSSKKSKSSAGGKSAKAGKAAKAEKPAKSKSSKKELDKKAAPITKSKDVASKTKDAASPKPSKKAEAPAKAPEKGPEKAPKAAKAAKGAKGAKIVEIVELEVESVVAEVKAAPKKAEAKKAESKKEEAPKDDGGKDDGKKDAANGRKGITIVTPKPMKRAKAAPAVLMPTGLGQLLGPNGPARKPLIPSGPKSPSHRAIGQHGGPDEAVAKPELKTHLGKKELEHFRALLLRKRAELVGDVSTMEKEALRGETGSLSSVPSHMAEQGSDTSEQSLSLDLAAADRKLIREIDDALNRIADGTYGVCELTGTPIKQERLDELPWARHSIEAARELERLAMRG